MTESIGEDYPDSAMSWFMTIWESMSRRVWHIVAVDLPVLKHHMTLILATLGAPGEP